MAPAAPSSAPPGRGFTCPTERARPDRDRPVVDYEFRLSDDRRTVTGTETVTFTPDLDTDRLVFRLVPNGPPSAQEGNRLTVDDVRGDDVDGGGYVAAGGADPGGLYEVRLDDELAAGDSTEVELDFTLTLGEGAVDRFGADDGLSWWAHGGRPRASPGGPAVPRGSPGTPGWAGRRTPSSTFSARRPPARSRTRRSASRCRRT